MQSFIFNDFKNRLLNGDVKGEDTWTFRFVNSKFSKDLEDKNIQAFTDLDMFWSFRNNGIDEANFITSSDYVKSCTVNLLPVYYTYSKAIETKTSDKPLYVDNSNWELFNQKYPKNEHLKLLFLNKAQGDFYSEYDTGKEDEAGNPIMNTRGFYYVVTSEELKWCADKVNGESDGVKNNYYNNYINIVLGDDIGTRDEGIDNLKEINYSIGKYPDRPFEGVLFGNGYRFRNLKILCNNNNNGIVGNLGKNGRVVSCVIEGKIMLKCLKKITLEHMTRDCTDINAGILVGKNNGQIDHCFMNGKVFLKGFVPGVYSVRNKTESSGAFSNPNSNEFFPNYLCINSMSNIVPYIGYFNEGVFATVSTGDYIDGKGYWKSNLLLNGENINGNINNYYPFDTYGTAEIPYPSAVQVNTLTMDEAGNWNDVTLSDDETKALETPITGHVLYYDYENMTNTLGLISDDSSTDYSDSTLSMIPRTGFSNNEYIDVSDSGKNVTSGIYKLNHTLWHDASIKPHSFNRIAYNTGILAGCNNGTIDNNGISAQAQCVDTFVGFFGGIAGKWNARENKVSNIKVNISAMDDSQSRREYYINDEGNELFKVNNLVSLYAPSVYFDPEKEISEQTYKEMIYGFDDKDSSFKYDNFKVDISKTLRPIKAIGTLPNSPGRNYISFEDTNLVTIGIRPIIGNESFTGKITKIGEIDRTQILLAQKQAFIKTGDELLKNFKNNPSMIPEEFDFSKNSTIYGESYLTNSKRGLNNLIIQYDNFYPLINMDKNNLNINNDSYNNENFFDNGIQFVNCDSIVRDGNNIILNNVKFKVESITNINPTNAKDLYCYPFTRAKFVSNDGTQSIEGVITTCVVKEIRLTIGNNDMSYTFGESDYIFNRLNIEKVQNIDLNDVEFTLYVPSNSDAAEENDKIYKVVFNSKSTIGLDNQVTVNYLKERTFIDGSRNYKIKKKSIKNFGGAFGRIVLGGLYPSSANNIETYLYNKNKIKFKQYINNKLVDYYGQQSTTYFSDTGAFTAEYAKYPDSGCYVYISGGEPVTAVIKKDKGVGADVAFDITTGMYIKIINDELGRKTLMYHTNTLSYPDLDDYTIDNRFGGFAAICDLDSCNISDKDTIDINTQKYIEFKDISAKYNEITEELKDNIYSCGPMHAAKFTESPIKYGNIGYTVPFGVALPFIAEIKPTCLSIPSIIESPNSNLTTLSLDGSEEENDNKIYGRIGLFTQDQNLASPTRDPEFWSINYNVDVPGSVGKIKLGYNLLAEEEQTECDIFNINYKMTPFMDKIFSFDNINLGRINGGIWKPGDDNYLKSEYVNRDSAGFGMGDYLYSTYPSTWQPLREQKGIDDISKYTDSKAIAPYQYFGSDLVLQKYNMMGFKPQTSISILETTGNNFAIGEYFNKLDFMISETKLGYINNNEVAFQSKIPSAVAKQYIVANTKFNGIVNTYEYNIENSDKPIGTNIFKYTVETQTADLTETFSSMQVNIILDENDNGQFGFNFKDSLSDINKDKLESWNNYKAKEEEYEERKTPRREREPIQNIENIYNSYFDRKYNEIIDVDGSKWIEKINSPYDGRILHIGKYLHEDCIAEQLVNNKTVRTSGISGSDFDGMLVIDSQNKPVMYLDVSMGDCDGTQTWMMPCSGTLGTSGIILEVKNGN